MAVAEELNVPPRRYEFQMLYGMADPIKDVLKSLGQRIRIYTLQGNCSPAWRTPVRRLLKTHPTIRSSGKALPKGLAKRCF